jgi:spermidine synthase
MNMNQENQFFQESFFYDTMKSSFKIKEVLHSEQSPYQKIEVFDTECVGKLLTLDGKTMVSDIDEFVYHEVLSHIPTMVSPTAENVLIIGGGDGGLVREFAKYPSLKKIDLVEIDKRVVDVSKIYFPDCTSALGDPRVTIHYEDGHKFIQQKENFYQIIVIDSTDPVDFASCLFTEEFYSMVSRALTSDGIMVAQTENPFLDQYSIRDIYKNLKAAFPIVKSWTAPMIIYPGVFWTYAFASKQFEPTSIATSKIPEFQKFAAQLKWYNLDWHLGAFKLSNFQKKFVE